METSWSPAVSVRAKEAVNEQKQLASSGTKEVVVEENISSKPMVKAEMVNVPGQDTERKDVQKKEEGEKNDAKKEEAKKSETTDVLCLQLDEGDFGVYLGKERARKKELLENKLKEEAKIENIEVKKTPMVRKAKTVKRLKTIPKKKIINIVQKKVKCKIVESNKSKDDKSQLDEKSPDRNEELKENKDMNKEEDKIDNSQESKEQPEVSVKSVVVNCDKEKGSRILWVSNINHYTKANDLKAYFTPYGKVQAVRIVTDGRNDYGYLVMEKKEDVENCVKNLEGAIFEGTKIHLSEKGPEQRKSQSNERKEKDGSSRDGSRKSSRHSSKSNDLLTLNVTDHQSEEKSRKYQRVQMLHDRRLEERREFISRQREAERIREERRKERIKYEERKAQEIKIEREKRKLEYERHLIEKEKLNLLRLQKRLADTERSLIQRQKQELERDIKKLESKKHKSSETYERKAKMPRIEERPKEYWKDRAFPKIYEEIYKKDNILEPPPPGLSENYHQKANKGKVWENKKEYSSERKEQEGKYSYPQRSAYHDKYQKDYEEIYKKDNILGRPPPGLSENYHQKADKGKVWENKKEYSSERKEQEGKYFYPQRSDYQDRYQKDRYKDKDKAYPWQNYSAGSTVSWRQEPTRSIATHTISFPVPENPYKVQTAPGYYQRTGYRKTNEYYCRGLERKY